MSASHPKATESLRSSEMTLSAKSRREQMQRRAVLFDNLVGETRHRQRYGQPERLGSLQIDNQGILVHALDRQIARLGAPENSIRVTGRLAELLEHVDARAVGHQATVSGELRLC